jgi:glutamate racemase
MPDGPIGIFDSGVGGLSVLCHIKARLPNERLIYVADQAHVPYGSRSLHEIRRFSEAIIRFLLARRAKLIVVACNTASGAALTQIRQTFPNVPFVGVEPAVKPAAAMTRSGKVGVLATASTFESSRYSDLMARFAREIEVYQDSCAGLVAQIESGAIDTPETDRLIRDYLTPMVAAGVDTVVLGCTHYPFVRSLIETIVGPEINIIDPAPAVARQAERLLVQRGLLALAGNDGEVQVYTTGEPHLLAQVGQRLLQYPLAVSQAVWQTADLLSA